MGTGIRSHLREHIESNVDCYILDTGDKGESLDVNADNFTAGGANEFAIELDFVPHCFHECDGKESVIQRCLRRRFSSVSAPHCTGSDLRERHFYIGSDVEDGGDCSVTTCKDALLEPANARSVVKRSPFASCFVTKPHTWHSHREHFGQTFAVPGSLAPRSTATQSHSGDEQWREEEEALPYSCDGCLGPVYVLPLREPTECSLCDTSSSPTWRGASGVARSLSRLCEDHGSLSRLQLL